MSTRYIYLGTVDPMLGARAEATIMKSVMANAVDTLLVYSRDRPTVSISAYAEEEECLHLDYVESNGIQIIRRVSGGSAIYTDQGQLVFCYVRRSTHETNEMGYARVCGYVALGLSKLGIDASHKPINDVISHGKKISGSAQYRDKAVTMQHGSVIISLDRESVEKSLKPLKAPGAPLSSIEEILGRTPEKREVADALASGFPDMTKGFLTEAERTCIDGNVRFSSSCRCR